MSVKISENSKNKQPLEEEIKETVPKEGFLGKFL